MVKIGHARMSENNSSGWDGKAKAGDQTGKEVCISNWYNKPWHTVLRPNDFILAQAMAKFCEDACNNNNIGYDQSQRNTAYKEAIRVNYNISMINTPCETDCSALMTLCAICGGVQPLEYDPIKGNAPRTSNMVQVFEKTGYFQTITDKKIVGSDKYLRRGDILVGNGHTVMVLSDGDLAKQEPKKTHKTLKKGMVDDEVAYLHSKLKPLGYGVNTYSKVFDNNTEQCVKHFQATNSLEIDGIVGAKTWGAIDG